MASELRDMDEDVSSLSRTLAVRTLQLEMEYIFSCLEDETLDIAQDLEGAGYLLLRYSCTFFATALNNCNNTLLPMLHHTCGPVNSSTRDSLKCMDACMSFALWVSRHHIICASRQVMAHMS